MHVENEEPLTWEWAGGFVDGEGYLDATIREYVKYGYKTRSLYTTIEISQEDPAVLQKLKDFIQAQLGITAGSIRPYPRLEKMIHLLHYSGHEDCYRIAKSLLPHLHLTKRRQQAQKLITAVEEYTHKEAATLTH